MGGKREKGKPTEDIKGYKFGRLTVLKFEEIRYNKSHWLCECDCGNTIVVHKGSLMSGNTKSCGCLIRDVARITQEVLRNMTYGRTH